MKKVFLEKIELVAGILCFAMIAFSCSSPEEKAKLAIKRAGYAYDSDSLCNAVSDNKIDIVKKFTQAGFDLNKPNAEDMTAMHLAADADNVQMLSLLLEAGADANVIGHQKRTPLMVAAMNGKKDALDLLLEKGVNTDLYDAGKWSALMLASYHGREECVASLVKASPSKQLDDALLLAAIQGNHRIIVNLIKAGAYVNHLSPDRNTALMFASRRGNENAAKALLAYGANRFLLNNENKTAAIIAREHKHDNLGELLGRAPVANEKKDLLKELAKLDADEAPAVNAVAQVEEKVNTLEEEVERNVGEIFSGEEEALVENALPSISENSDAGIFAFESNIIEDLEGKIDEKIVVARKSDAVEESNFATRLTNAPTSQIYAASFEAPSKVTKIKLKKTAKAGVIKPQQRLQMSEYIEKELPLALEKVRSDNQVARVRKLYGDYGAHDVRVGDYIPETDYRLQSANHISTATKSLRGAELDISRAELFDTRNGELLNIQKTLPGRVASPIAVVKDNLDGSIYRVKASDKFYDEASEQDFEILDVRPNQLVLKNLKNGKTFVIPKE